MNVRDRFFNTIYEKTKLGSDIMIVSSDLGAPSLDDFRKDFPQRFANAGIAEQNSIAVAAGLSMAGKIAITYGLNPFPVTRGFDHIRNTMASLRLPITVCGLKAGTATAEAGFSHMALENMSLLRTLRNIQIINPSDETISEKVAEVVIENPKPRYIQFDPFISERMYERDDIDFEKGFVTSGRKSQVVVISYGIWAYKIKKEMPETRMIDCFSLPVNVNLFIDEIKSAKKIVTIEDGIDAGGLGSMVLEIMNDAGIYIPMKRMSLRFNHGYPDNLTDRNQIFEDEGLRVDVVKKEMQI